MIHFNSAVGLCGLQSFVLTFCTSCRHYEDLVCPGEREKVSGNMSICVNWKSSLFSVDRFGVDRFGMDR